MFGNIPLEEHSIFIETCGAILHFFWVQGTLLKASLETAHRFPDITGLQVDDFRAEMAEADDQCLIQELLELLGIHKTCLFF